jgi:hypothetical protein
MCDYTAAAGAGACTTANGRFVGNVVADVFTCSACSYPSFTNSEFSFQLISRSDLSTALKAAADPVNPTGDDNNPQVIIRQDVFAEAHSNR